MAHRVSIVIDSLAKSETYWRITVPNCKSYNTEIQSRQLSLSECETILTKDFKRVILGGKGSNPMAILFKRSAQKCIDLMLKVRNQCMLETNEYLFGNSSTDNRWLSGYHVFLSYRQNR